MPIASTVGLACIGVSAAGFLTSRFNKTGRMLNLMTEVLEMANVEVRHSDGYTDTKIFKPKILKVKKRTYGFDVKLKLPKGYSVDKFRAAIPVIEQGTVSKIRAKHLQGREVLLELGMKQLRDRMDFNPASIKSGDLSIPYFTPFGVRKIDFFDETCCHIIVAGATRMGKSVFLRLLFAVLTVAMDGNIKFFYINNKKADYVPLRGIPQLPAPAETVDEAVSVLNDVFIEMNVRKNKLDKYWDCVNIKQYREKHPEDPVPPLFVVIDEYGRFADNDAFQEKVMEIAETAGYLDIHLVIATQRPEAKTVLNPRTRANILTRICFQTADEANSNMVVHIPDAAHLDEIRGRAIVLDGIPTLGQIPYISEDATANLLLPYRRDLYADIQRQTSVDVPETLPGIEQRSFVINDLSRYSEAVGDDQPDYATSGAGRSRTRHSKAKR